MSSEAESAGGFAVRRVDVHCEYRHYENASEQSIYSICTSPWQSSSSWRQAEKAECGGVCGNGGDSCADRGLANQEGGCAGGELGVIEGSGSLNWREHLNLPSSRTRGITHLDQRSSCS